MRRAHYFISGVWHNTTGTRNYISHVLLHKADPDGTFYLGEKKTKNEVLALLDAGYVIRTIYWDYESAVFQRGAEVHPERLGTNRYLRSSPDATVIDNLDNLVDMIVIV
jgi:hypothetical protein